MWNQRRINNIICHILSKNMMIQLHFPLFMRIINKAINRKISKQRGVRHNVVNASTILKRWLINDWDIKTGAYTPSNSSTNNETSAKSTSYVAQIVTQLSIKIITRWKIPCFKQRETREAGSVCSFHPVYQAWRD